MFFHRNRAEYTDLVIDLIPVHFTPPDSSMGFGHEQIWKITLHNNLREEEMFISSGISGIILILPTEGIIMPNGRVFF